jgi:hypothetical protein
MMILVERMKVWLTEGCSFVQLCRSKENCGNCKDFWAILLVLVSGGRHTQYDIISQSIEPTAISS